MGTARQGQTGHNLKSTPTDFFEGHATPGAE